VPVFQEQVMQVAMLAAGFTPGEADGLRRSMAAWKRKGGLEKYYSKIVDGMTARGYEQAFAESIFEQIKGFSEYGFPESHSASFALLVYASSWIKCHEPAAFLAALLNSQPHGLLFRQPTGAGCAAPRRGAGRRCHAQRRRIVARRPARHTGGAPGPAFGPRAAFGQRPAHRGRARQGAL
jgi:hypothetical protein